MGKESYLFDHLDVAAALLCSGRPGLITDFDGTISEVAPTPQQAQVSPLCRERLGQLARRLALVAVVSGRPVLEVRRMVGVEGLAYVGNHGLEHWEDGVVEVEEVAAEYASRLAEVLAELRQLLPLEGLILEDKGLTASIHYRLSPEPEQASRSILAHLQTLPPARGLRVIQGREVVELRPPVDRDKGSAVRDLIQRHRLSAAFYLGDDITDVDAFVALNHVAEARQRQKTPGTLFRGLAVAVTGPETSATVAAQADFTLRGLADVERFLTWLWKETSR